MWMVLHSSLGMLSQDMHSWSMGEPFPGLPRNKKLSPFPPPNQNMWLLHTQPRRPFGFADLLVRYSNRSPTQYHFIQTHKLPSHSPVMGLIMLAPSTLTFGIILFDSSLQIISFIALLMTWLPTILPTWALPNSKVKHFAFMFSLQSTWRENVGIFKVD